MYSYRLSSTKSAWSTNLIYDTKPEGYEETILTPKLLTGVLLSYLRWDSVLTLHYFLAVRIQHWNNVLCYTVAVLYCSNDMELEGNHFWSCRVCEAALEVKVIVASEESE